MKYQQRIHKAFAEFINKDAKEKAEEKYAKLTTDFPELKDTLDESVFYAYGVEAIATGNVEICDLFSRDTPRIGPNIRAYQTIQRYADMETNPEYVSVYKALISAYKKYFSLAAEDTLVDYYGPKYTDFVAEQTKKIEAEMKAAADKRKAAADKEN